ILDLSKIEAGRVNIEVGPLTLADIRSYVEQAFKAQAEQKGLELLVRMAGGVDQMVTDAQRLQQILRNLLSNAVKFTDSGSVTLTIEPAPRDVVFGVPTLDAASRVMAFAVADTGIGISDTKFTMIFEAFQQADGTTSRKYGGTGLGLSISRELARMLGGVITVTSTVAEGSTFTLYLPEGPPPDKPATPARTAESTDGDWRPARTYGVTPILRPARAGRRGSPARRLLEGATVLIVDDDVRNVFALTSALELHGLSVLYADNGADGLRMLTEHPEVDVVLMDAMMPDLDGNQTTRLIRELPGGATLPVVFLTAKAMPGDRESSFAAGATDYVTKPVDLDELLEAMSNWVALHRAQAGGR
ncbi:MAG: ATP-binding protein, partial [Pseudonocardiaceae bacterium]